MWKLAILSLSWLLFASCASRRETVKVVTHHTTDTLIQYRNVLDSIYLHDSIYVADRGDTIYMERWHTKYKYVYKTDTIWQIRVDSIPVIQTITKVERERYTPRIMKILSTIGVATILALGIFLILKFR